MKSILLLFYTLLLLFTDFAHAQHDTISLLSAFRPQSIFNEKCIPQGFEVEESVCGRLRCSNEARLSFLFGFDYFENSFIQFEPILGNSNSKLLSRAELNPFVGLAGNINNMYGAINLGFDNYEPKENDEPVKLLLKKRGYCLDFGYTLNSKKICLYT